MHRWTSAGWFKLCQLQSTCKNVKEMLLVERAVPRSRLGHADCRGEAGGSRGRGSQERAL